MISNNETVLTNTKGKIRNSNPARINPNNEVKISLDTDVHQAIDFITNLFINQHFEKIIICGLSKAIRKVVLITEIVKTKVNGLFQINKIDCLKKRGKTNEYDDDMGMVPRLEIILSTKEPSNEEKSYQGYQGISEYNKTKTVHKVKRRRYRYKNIIKIGLRRFIRKRQNH